MDRLSIINHCTDGEGLNRNNRLYITTGAPDKGHRESGIENIREYMSVLAQCDSCVITGISKYSSVDVMT